jgi:hypothetical protein
MINNNRSLIIPVTLSGNSVILDIPIADTESPVINRLNIIKSIHDFTNIGLVVDPSMPNQTFMIIEAKVMVIMMTDTDGMLTILFIRSLSVKYLVDA